MDGDRGDLIVRTLRADDLARLVKMDEALSGRRRSAWYEGKLDRALKESDVCISLGAEVDGMLVGAVMGTVNFGEYGLPEPVAILDTLLVDGRKAVGCAQTRRRGAVLIHAAILLGTDADLIARVFRTAVDEVDAGLTAAIPGGDWRGLGRTIAGDLADALGRSARDIPEPELARRHLEPYAEERWAPLGCDLVKRLLAKK